MYPIHPYGRRLKPLILSDHGKGANGPGKKGFAIGDGT